MYNSPDEQDWCKLRTISRQNPDNNKFSRNLADRRSVKAPLVHLVHWTGSDTLELFLTAGGSRSREIPSVFQDCCNVNDHAANF